MTSQTVDSVDVVVPAEPDVPSGTSGSHAAGPRFLESAWLVPLASVAGVAMAFGLVVAWFPKTWEMWNMPIQAIDAPSHYYFIRKLLRDGLSVAFELNPNDSFYPPLFHLMVYCLIKVAGFFGCTVNIFTGLNLVWIFASGLLFPAGMLLWCSYFFSDLPRHYRAVLSVIVPILSVASASHPYWMLDAGPLIAYGLATSLLPFLLYAGLRLIDALTIPAQRSKRNVLFWGLVNLALGLIVLLAHPRIAFTYLVFMAFFIILKMPLKFIASAAVCGCVAVVCFAFYVMHRDHGKDYLHPSRWFHTFRPTRGVMESVCVVMTDYLPGVAGWVMAACICVALVTSLLLSGSRFKDGLSLVLSFLLTGIVFVCSAALQGPIANILTAAWYRGETRPLTMIPLAIVPLLSFACRCLILAAGSHTRQKTGNGYACNRYWAWPVLVVLLVLALLGNLLNPVRHDVSKLAEDKTSLKKVDQREQLTEDKFQALTRIRDVVEPDALIISDPLNGSMYGMTLYGLNMLYPVYNPMDSKNGKVFSQVEQAFGSGDSSRFKTTLCSAESSYVSHGRERSKREHTYFLTMGPQSPSLELFTYKDQYYPFHDSNLIEQYEQRGDMARVVDFGNAEKHGEEWVLYRLNCS